MIDIRDFNISEFACELLEFIEDIPNYSLEIHIEDEDTYVNQFKYFNLYHEGCSSLFIECADWERSEHKEYTVNELYEYLENMQNYKLQRNKDISIGYTDSCDEFVENFQFEFIVDHENSKLIIKGNNIVL